MTSTLSSAVLSKGSAGKHSLNGGAFEYSLGHSIEGFFQHKVPVDFDLSLGSAGGAKAKYDRMPLTVQNQYDNHAQTLLSILLLCEPFLRTANTQITLEMPSAQAGASNDRRDLKVMADGHTFGISAKVRNKYVFHPRISPDRDFAAYAGSSFSSGPAFNKELTTAFNVLQKPITEMMYWSAAKGSSLASMVSPEQQDYDEAKVLQPESEKKLRGLLYQSITQVLLDELNRQKSRKGFAQGLLEGILGTQPYYLCCLTTAGTEITVIDLHGTLRRNRGKEKTCIPVCPTRPAEVEKLVVSLPYDHNTGKKYEQTLLLRFMSWCGDDWVISARIHTADRRIVKNVKIEFQVISMPDLVPKFFIPFEV